MEQKCKCGDKAEYYIVVPFYNIYSGLDTVNEEIPLCNYHKNIAREAGHKIYVL